MGQHCFVIYPVAGAGDTLWVAQHFHDCAVLWPPLLHHKCVAQPLCHTAAASLTQSSLPKLFSSLDQAAEEVFFGNSAAIWPYFLHETKPQLLKQIHMHGRTWGSVKPNRATQSQLKLMGVGCKVRKGRVDSLVADLRQ